MLVNLFLALAFLSLAVLIAKLTAKKKALSGDEVVAYEKRGPLLTPAERSFYGALEQAVGGQALIFVKVRLADVIKPTKTVSASDWQRAFNKISAKHLDFVICRKNDLVPLLAIELNDRSHQASNRRRRDDFLANALESAGLAHVSLPARQGYSVTELRQIILPHLAPSPEGQPVASDKGPATKPDVAENSKQEVRLCPVCSSPLVKRVARKGKHAGKEFWACSAYPKCKYIEPVDG